MYNDITIFTVDCGNIPLYENRRYRFCLDRLKEVLPKNVTFKIFTKEDQIVKDCFKEFKDYFNLVRNSYTKGNEFSLISDVIRIYILSKNKHYLYLDADIYIKDFSFLEELKKEAVICPYDFAFLWSGEENEYFIDYLNFYKSCKIKVYRDFDVISKVRSKIKIKFNEDFYFRLYYMHLSNNTEYNPNKKYKFIKTEEEYKTVANVIENLPNVFGLSFCLVLFIRKEILVKNFYLKGKKRLPAIVVEVDGDWFNDSLLKKYVDFLACEDAD